MAQDYDELVQQAQEARRQGQYLKAANLLREAYALSPEAVLLNNIGKMYEEAGQYRKAFDTYKEVADDPNADDALRLKDEQRMNNLKPMLSQGHFKIKRGSEATNVWLGDRIDASAFAAEQQLRPGRHHLEIQRGNIAYIIPTLLVAAERVDVDIDESVAAATATLDSANVAGLETLSINGYALQSDLGSIRAVKLVPGSYDIELTFADESKYELLKKLTGKESLQLGSYATTFTRIEAGAGMAGHNQDNLWIKSSAVALGVGLTTAGGFMSYNAHSETDDILRNNTLTMYEARDRWVEARDSGDTGVVLMSVGLTALTGGVLWLMLDNKDTRSSDVWEFGPLAPFQPAYSASSIEDSSIKTQQGSVDAW